MPVKPNIRKLVGISYGTHRDRKGSYYDLKTRESNMEIAQAQSDKRSKLETVNKNIGGYAIPTKKQRADLERRQKLKAAMTKSEEQKQTKIGKIRVVQSKAQSEMAKTKARLKSNKR